MLVHWIFFIDCNVHILICLWQGQVTGIVFRAFYWEDLDYPDDLALLPHAHAHSIEDATP